MRAWNLQFHRRIVAAHLSFAALVAGCSSSSSDAAAGAFPAAPLAVVTSASGKLTVSVWTAPDQPPQRGVSTAKLEVKDAAGQPVDGLSLEVVPWMPAMGHGSPEPTTVTAQGHGDYLVENVSLFMAGHWELRTTFHDGAEDVATAAFDVP